MINRQLTEEQEELNEIFAKDQDLFNYIMFYEDEDLDCLDYDEKAYLRGDYDDEIIDASKKAVS